MTIYNHVIVVSGTLIFHCGAFVLSKVLNVHVLNDDLPELAEHFIISLVSAISGDGKVGSTPTSGASIDPEKASTQVVIKSSDHPYGNYVKMCIVYVQVIIVAIRVVNDYL